MDNNTYITMQGDAWDSIAYKLWGEERLFVHLMQANKDYIDTVIFSAEIKLTVPEIPSQSKKMELPPWRR